MRFIGDVHGTEKRFAQYREIALASPDGRSIQVGDFGAGFMDPDNSGITPLPAMDMNHRFIRGNHDDPAVCRSSPNWIADGTVEGDMFFCGGAESIDKARRMPGIDWWHDEEVSMAEGYAMYDRFADGELKPRIMVTHDLPFTIGSHIFGASVKNRVASWTGQLMQAIFDVYKPEIWIFGHWHMPKDVNILGTRFICVDMIRPEGVAYIDLDV